MNDNATTVAIHDAHEHCPYVIGSHHCGAFHAYVDNALERDSRRTWVAAMVDDFESGRPFPPGAETVADALTTLICHGAIGDAEALHGTDGPMADPTPADDCDHVTDEDPHCHVPGCDGTAPTDDSAPTATHYAVPGVRVSATLDDGRHLVAWADEIVAECIHLGLSPTAPNCADAAQYVAWVSDGELADVDPTDVAWAIIGDRVAAMTYSCDENGERV